MKIYFFGLLTSTLLLYVAAAGAIYPDPGYMDVVPPYPSNATTCGSYSFGDGVSTFDRLGNNSATPNKHQYSDVELAGSEVELYLFRTKSWFTKEPTVIFMHGGNGNQNADPVVYGTYLKYLISRDAQVL